MSLSESVKKLINNFNKYVGDPNGVERSPEAALKWITVVAKDTDVMYHVTGVYYNHTTGTRTICLMSNNPIVQDKDVIINEKPVVGVSIEYSYDDVTTEEFDKKYMLYADWAEGLLNLTVAEMNIEIFKFLQDHMIPFTNNWSFEFTARGRRMSLTWWPKDKYSNLTIYVNSIDDVEIRLYGEGSDVPTVDVFSYNNGKVETNPVAYGPLDIGNMSKLCSLVEGIIRRHEK